MVSVHLKESPPSQPAWNIEEVGAKWPWLKLYRGQRKPIQIKSGRKEKMPFDRFKF